MYEPSPVEETAEEMALETTEAQTVTPVTPVTHDVPQGTDPMALATNGHSNGHHNGVHPHTGTGCDPVCPQCGKNACQPYGLGGRVCMQCGYCERPLRPAR